MNLASGLSGICKISTLSSPNVGDPLISAIAIETEPAYSAGRLGLCFIYLFINVGGSCWEVRADIRGKRVKV